MSKEPKSEWARYAFGYSDKKPSRISWGILFILWVSCILIIWGLLQ